MSSQSLSLRDAFYLGTAVAVGSAATAAVVAVATTIALSKYTPFERLHGRPAQSRSPESCSIESVDGKTCRENEADDGERRQPVVARVTFSSPTKTGAEEESSDGVELIPSQLCKIFDRVRSGTDGEKNVLFSMATISSDCSSEWSTGVEATPQSKKTDSALQSDCHDLCSGGGDLHVVEAQSSCSIASECWEEKQACRERENPVADSANMHKPSPLSKALVNGKRIDPADPRKREDYLSWDDYFMAIAFLSAKRSKDPNRQVGACIVGQDKVILGIGYNGFPRNISDDDLPWAKVADDNDPLKTKYPYVCHAEVNAVLNKNSASATGQRLYVTLFPCNECAKIIIQSGIAEVVYFQDKGCHEGEGSAAPDPIYAASRRLLSLAGINVWQHKPKRTIIIDCN